MEAQLLTDAEAKAEGLALKLEYTDAEKEYRAKVLARIEAMYEERERPRMQFDDMTYSQWDDVNQQIDSSYIPPARNKGDVRIVTGMTREKDTSLVSTALSLKASGSVKAFDENNQIVVGLGEEMEDMVNKSFEIEELDDKLPLVYRGIFSRGTYFVLDVWNEANEVVKELGKGHTVGSLKADWTERVQKGQGFCETVLWDPRKVLLGDYAQFNVQKQPDIDLWDVISYDDAWQFYGHFDRFKYVPYELVRAAPSMSDLNKAGPDHFNENWGIAGIEKGQVERHIYMNLPKKEVQLFLNGVQMFPVMDTGRKDARNKPIVSGYPITCIAPGNMYPVVKGDYEPQDGLAISKSQPAKLKVDQAIQDEALKLFILGFRQSRQPTWVNNSGKRMTSEDFLPNRTHVDIPKDSVYPLYQNVPQLTSAEFSFYELIKQGMEDKSVSAQYEGQGSGEQTATGILENRKQQILKLGLGMDSIMRFHRDLWYVRIANILKHWTEPLSSSIDEVTRAVSDQYRQYTLEKQGASGPQRKIGIFRTDVADITAQDPSGELLHQAEVDMETQTGTDTRISMLDPKALAAWRGMWYVTMQQLDKKDDALSRMLFVENITHAVNLWGPQAISPKLKERFTTIIGEDYDTWFVDEQELQNKALEEQTMMQAEAQEKATTTKSPATKTKPTMKKALQA
jgi:hypothetical protein